VKTLSEKETKELLQKELLQKEKERLVINEAVLLLQKKVIELETKINTLELRSRL